MKTTLVYKDMEIYADEFIYKSGFTWISKNYDGPEDRRIGFCSTVEECIEQIDEFLAR